MSILDWLFVGNVIKDFGPIEQQSIGIGRLKLGQSTESVLLIEKAGKMHLVLKSVSWFLPLGGGFGYREMPMDKARRLRDLINKSERIAADLTISDFDAGRGTRRTVIVIGLIGALLLLLTSSLTATIATVAGLLAVWAKLYRDLHHNLLVVPQAKSVAVWLIGLTLMAGAFKLVWPWAR
jgi:hypothetical protein